MEQLVTVVIPVYNMAAYLDTCMESVLGQTYTALEILLIDDGSVDASPSMCDGYAQRDRRVRVIHQPNGGISRARNRGIEEATGEYITFVDADDALEKDCIRTLAALCAEYQVRLSACNHWLWRDDRMKPCFPRDEGERRIAQSEMFHGALYHRAPDVSVWGKLYHRSSLFETVRFPPGRLFEDTYCFGELARQVDAMAYTSVPLYRYRIRPGSISHSEYDERQEEYIEAVEHLTQIVLALYPEEKRGCARRSLHALMSVRCCLIDCPERYQARRRQLDRQIRAKTWPLLLDREAPKRDKIAALSLLLGSRCYDQMWKFYSAHR